MVIRVLKLEDMISKALIKKFFLLISKPKFAIFLIFLILFEIFLSFLIPQIALYGPNYYEQLKIEKPFLYYIINILQLNRIYTSIWFLLPIFLALMSLGYTLYLLFTKNIKKNTPTTFLRKDLGQASFSTLMLSLIG